MQILNCQFLKELEIPKKNPGPSWVIVIPKYMYVSRGVTKFHHNLSGCHRFLEILDVSSKHPISRFSSNCIHTLCELTEGEQNQFSKILRDS